MKTMMELLHFHPNRAHFAHDFVRHLVNGDGHNVWIVFLFWLHHSSTMSTFLVVAIMCGEWPIFVGLLISAGEDGLTCPTNLSAIDTLSDTFDANKVSTNAVSAQEMNCHGAQTNLRRNDWQLVWLVS